MTITEPEARRRLVAAYRIEASAALQAAKAIQQGQAPAEVRHIVHQHREGVSEATEVLSAVRAGQQKRGTA